MNKASFVKKAADARSKSLSKTERKIEVFNFKIQDQKRQIIEPRSQIEKAYREFLKQSKFQNPVCFGWRFAFPDGDFLCENCLKNKLLKSQEIKKIANFLREQKINTDNLTPEEIAEIIFSCRMASDRRLSDFNRKLEKTETNIRKRSQENGDSDAIIEIKIRKTLEPLISNFEKEKKKIGNKRKKEIEKILKGG